MKAKAILLTVLYILPLCSCDTRSDLDKQIDTVNRQCGFMLNSKLEDFPPSWKGEFRGTLEHFEFKETRQDGIDVYTCGTWDYLTTVFYYRDGLEVGFKTRDPQFYFSIFGRTIGSPIYSFEGANYKDLTTVLIERSYDPVTKKVHENADIAPNGLRYSWLEYTYKEKLHINFSYEPIYSFNGKLAEIEVFLDK